MKRADVVQDAEELLTAGETAETAALRMGMTAGSIARALYRAARPDLARPFGRAHRAAHPRDNHPWTPARAEMQRRRRHAALTARPMETVWLPGDERRTA